MHFGLAPPAAATSSRGLHTFCELAKRTTLAPSNCNRLMSSILVLLHLYDRIHSGNLLLLSGCFSSRDTSQYVAHRKDVLERTENILLPLAMFALTICRLCTTGSSSFGTNDLESCHSDHCRLGLARDSRVFLTTESVCFDGMYGSAAVVAGFALWSSRVSVTRLAAQHVVKAQR